MPLCCELETRAEAAERDAVAARKEQSILERHCDKLLSRMHREAIEKTSAEQEMRRLRDSDGSLRAQLARTTAHLQAETAAKESAHRLISDKETSLQEATRTFKKAQRDLRIEGAKKSALNAIIRQKAGRVRPLEQENLGLLERLTSTDGRLEKTAVELQARPVTRAHTPCSFASLALSIFCIQSPWGQVKEALIATVLERPGGRKRGADLRLLTGPCRAAATKMRASGTRFARCARSCGAR